MGTQKQLLSSSHESFFFFFFIDPTCGWWSWHCPRTQKMLLYSRNELFSKQISTQKMLFASRNELLL